MILLAFNEITDIDINAFNLNGGPNTALATLFLGDNKITELQPGVFDKLVKLKTLDLTSNPVANYTAL